MKPLLECFTLSGIDLMPGIRAAAFDSIVSDDDNVVLAELKTVPIMPLKGRSLPDRTSLSVSFLEGRPDGGKPSKSGIVLAYSPEQWRLATDRTKLILLDPAGTDGQVLLYLEKSSGIALASLSDKELYVSVNSSCRPVLGRHSRASMLLSAIDVSGTGTGSADPASSSD